MAIKFHTVELKKALRAGLKRARKVRPGYVALLGLTIGGLVFFFEWHFVKELVLAIGVESALHHLCGLAIGAAEEAA